MTNLSAIITASGGPLARTFDAWDGSPASLFDFSPDDLQDAARIAWDALDSPAFSQVFSEQSLHLAANRLSWFARDCELALDAILSDAFRELAPGAVSPDGDDRFERPPTSGRRLAARRGF